MDKINFKKGNDLVPVVIQDTSTKNVLMLGYMNEEALKKTINEGLVTFYSRSKKRLWTKGEESGNYLYFVSYAIDCDQDSLLIQVNPTGPVCHKGTDSCWNEENKSSYGFLSELEKIIEDRKKTDNNDSYINSLFSKGINKIAQKVGEEAVELVIEAKDDNPKLFKDEAADLLFHYLILLNSKRFKLDDIVQNLLRRNQK